MKKVKSVYVRAFLRFLFSHVGLCTLVFAYCVLGALIFLKFESTKEFERLDAANQEACTVEENRKALIERVQNEILNADMNVSVVKMWLDEYQRNLTEVLTEHHGSYFGVCHVELPLKWTMPSAVLFTVTSVAAIGYGNLVPTTQMSRFVFICYSLLGIPLTLMFLANIGRLFASTVRLVFSRGLCYFCWRRRERSHEHIEICMASDDMDDPRHGMPMSHSNATLATTLDEGFVDHDDSPLTKTVDKNKTSKCKSVEQLAIRDDQPKYPLNYDRQMSQERLQMIVPLTFIFGILSFYTLCGTLLFSWSEDWSTIQSAYFNVITLLTIGLGDYVPGWDDATSTKGQIKMCLGAVYIMTGLGLLSMGLNLIVDELLLASHKAGRKIGLFKDDDDSKPKKRSNLQKAVRPHVY